MFLKRILNYAIFVRFLLNQNHTENFSYPTIFKSKMSTFALEKLFNHARVRGRERERETRRENERGEGDVCFMEYYHVILFAHFACFSAKKEDKIA